MGKVSLIVLIFFIDFSNPTKKIEYFGEIGFGGEAVIYDIKNDKFYKYTALNKDAQKHIPIASITKNVNAAYVLWLSQSTNVILESDVRNQYHLLANLPNEVTIKDLLIHSSGITEASIHTGNSQAFYPGLEYDYQGMNYSILRSIIDLKSIDFKNKFHDFIGKFDVSEIGFINDLEQFDINKENFLEGSSDLFANTYHLAKLISKIYSDSVLSDKNKRILTEVNFTLDDSTKKTAFGDKYVSTNDKTFFIQHGRTTNNEILLAFSPDLDLTFLLTSNGKEDLFEIFENYYNKISKDKIQLPKSKTANNFYIYIIPVILTVFVVILFIKRKK